MSGFGRKGSTAAGPSSFGAAMAQRNRASVPADREPAPSAELAAFLASERQRRPETVEPGLSDVAIATPRARNAGTMGGGAPKSMLLAYVLWWFACAIGAHRFYLGATGSGLAMLGLFVGGLVIGLIVPPLGLLMLGGWAIWVIVDAFLIPGLVRRTREYDADAVFA